MKTRMLIQFTVLQLMLVSFASYPQTPMSEIEQNTAYVASFVESNEEQLTKLLRGMSGIEVNIYFRTNSADINWLEKQKIINVAKAMWVYPMLNVSLGGHADRRGPNGYNKILTETRIEAVNKIIRDILGKKYDPSRLYKVAYGEQLASQKSSDTEAMSLDRRVSILLLIQPRNKE